MGYKPPTSWSTRIEFRISVVTEHPRLFILASLLLASFFIAFSPLVRTVDNVDYFKLDHDPDVDFYNHFKEIFGGDEFFVIAFETEKLFTKPILTLLQNITTDLDDLEEIRKVTSLANIDDTIGSADYFEVRKFLDEIPDDREGLARLKEQAVDNPLYVRNFVSPDGNTAAIVVETYDRPDDDGYRKRLIDKTHAILDRYRDQVGSFHLAGWTTTNLYLSEYLKEDMRVFVPVTFVLIAVTVWFFFRSLILASLALANTTLCVASTVGLMGMTGVTLNNVTSIVVPLGMALALCDSVHIFSHLDRRILDQYGDKRKALSHVLERLVLPCFLTSLTTAIGFLSLATSEIPPIRQFAYIGSASMIFEFSFSFFFLAPMLVLSSPDRIFSKKYYDAGGMSSFLNSHYTFIRRYHRWIVAATCLVVLAACWLTTRVRVETNVVEYFKEASPVRTSLAYVEKRLAGVGALDVSLRAAESEAFKDPANLRVIEEIQKDASRIEGVDKTISLVDFLKDMNKSFHDEDHRYYTLPESKALTSQYLLLYDSDELERVINSDYSHARISVRLSKHSTSEQSGIIKEVREIASHFADSGLEINVTGRAVKDVNMIDALVKSQVYSMSTGGLTIGLIMVLALRSTLIGLLSLIPNIYPILINFGIMGAAGIPLNTGTALIAALALGIAVDDSIHFLSEYMACRSRKMSIQESLRTVITTKGVAIFCSSVILCIGFGVLLLSRFIPMVHFGLLTGIVMLIGFTGDMVLLPSIMLLKREERLQSADSLAPQPQEASTKELRSPP
jgi:predicted RND superfamily exporter protein